MSYQIAIDGPAGAGKSTIAKELAKRLGFIYVDTGAMYRAMALYLLREGVPMDDSGKISAASQRADITIAYKDGLQQVLLDGENVTTFLRTEEVGNMASVSSANPDVRKKLVELQQNLANRENVVMDGRDIGTCVLPNADVKVYLTASASCRAKRRYEELTAKGETCDLGVIEADIEKRDHQDMTREHSPLRQAEDAVFLDSSKMTIREVVERILVLVER
ncbi:MAG: (d)CMP kinase [Lachnospiraceae bacterium]|nr:(d)CMP kinase [Lachnospiraceae bacterium]